MRYLILAILSLFVISCSNGDKETESNTDSIQHVFINEASVFLEVLRNDCNIFKSEEELNNLWKKLKLSYIGDRSNTVLEANKGISCKKNIRNLTCDSEAVVKFDLSLVPDCLFYENTKGFPTAKTTCEGNMTGFCQAPRSCVDGVSCEVYQGGMPFRQGCAEPHTGTYTCTGDYDNAPFCKPFWVEYTSGCHDEPGYVKENSFDDLCDKFGNVLLIEDDSILEQFETCYNARPQTCEGLYDINYDISTIPECQFIFAE